MALNQANRIFQEYTMMFNDFERRSKADINDDVLCNPFIVDLANVTDMTHAMSHRAKSVTPL
jgi:hypothetical protein